MFDQHKVDGLALTVQRLQTDVTGLKQQLMAQTMAPEQLVGIITHNMRSLAEVRSNGEEERYSRADLSGFAANLEGTRKVIDLLRPLLAKTAGELLQRIDAASTAFGAELDSLKTESGYRPYDQVANGQRQQIADSAKALADALDGIDPALGLKGL